MSATPVETVARRPGIVASARRLQMRYPVAQLVFLVVLFAYGAATLDGFSSRRSIYSMLVLAALLGMATAGQTLCVLIGGIDFSIAAWIAMGAILLVQLNGTRGWSFGTTALLIAALAIAGGASVGFICHRWRIDPLIVTLAMGAIVNGALLVWAKGFITGAPRRPGSRRLVAGQQDVRRRLPAARRAVGRPRGRARDLPHRTPTGRRLYATGANMRAAQMALVRTRLVWMGVFAFSALVASLTGILLGGFAGAADASLGTNYLWLGLTAVIVGGTAFGRAATTGAPCSAASS